MISLRKSFASLLELAKPRTGLRSQICGMQEHQGAPPFLSAALMRLPKSLSNKLSAAHN